MEYFREKAVIYIIILPITIHVTSKVLKLYVLCLSQRLKIATSGSTCNIHDVSLCNMYIYNFVSE